ncbi:MAG: 5'-nucleotidase C-terminal domain-containing protein [Christensenellales bacterium]|nr:5'-nucleotidase C-terminal domain-containing protein [Christensenellales bacterium]
MTTITILGTSDLHGCIENYDYENKIKRPGRGMAYAATCIDEIRTKSANVLLLDNGDAIQGTLLTDKICALNPEKTHPVIDIMNHLRYDVMTLGNHEFSWGVPVMQTILSQADFPVLSANIFDENGQSPVDGGWRIFERSGVRIAVIGVTTPHIRRWFSDQPGVDALMIETPGTAVRRCIKEIGNQADVIVVCAHMGMNPEFDLIHGTDAAERLLNENPEIDVLLAGHSHSSVCAQYGTTLVGAPTNDGAEIVCFELRLDAHKRITDRSVALIDVRSYALSQKVCTLSSVEAAHQQALNYRLPTHPNGNTTIIGEATASFRPDDEIRGIPSPRIMNTAMVDLLNRIQLRETGADISAASLFSDNINFHKGVIDSQLLAEFYPYEDNLCRVRITGAELKAYMEWSAACFNQWKPGDINISFVSNRPIHLHDIFAGIRYQIDLSRPAGSRVQNVLFRNAPLKEEQELTIAVKTYRFSTILSDIGLPSQRTEWISQRSIREIIEDYISKNSPLQPILDHNWEIVGIDLAWNDPLRSELIARINAGELNTPYYESINLNDYR